MANKRIRTDAPDTVSGVQRRVAQIALPESDDHGSPAFEEFSGLVMDTLAGIAEAGKEGCRAPDDPVEVAREVLRFGAVLYEDREAWITWDDSEGSR